MKSKKGLGKGLSALIADAPKPGSNASEGTKATASTKSDSQSPQEIPLDAINPGALQPRKFFSEEHLKELSLSIKKNGLLQPIIVRKNHKGKGYEIIAGERRWRASKMAGKKTIPAIVKDFTNKQALELGLIENIQRQDLTPLEEAQGYKRLMDEFDYTQEALASVIGKSRSHIANLLRLLNVPDEIKALLSKGEITLSHIKTIMNADNNVALAKEIAKKKLSVRDAERLINKPKKAVKTSSSANTTTSSTKKTAESSTSPKTLSVAEANKVIAAQLATRSPQSKKKDPDIIYIEEKFTEMLGLGIRIEEGENEGGFVAISFGNLNDLDKILQRLGAEPIL